MAAKKASTKIQNKKVGRPAKKEKVEKVEEAINAKDIQQKEITTKSKAEEKQPKKRKEQEEKTKSDEPSKKAKTETVGKSQKRNKSKGKESAKEVVEEENGSGSESELDSEDEQELMRAIDKEMVDGQEAEGDDTLAEDEEVEELEKDKIILDKNIKAIVEKKLSKTKNRNDGRGIIYLGRIPHGFYEKQMKQYFSQFGKITRLRLSRNKITGRPKHYAFIEFQQKEVAEIVAETMNNYLLYNRLLKCQLLAPEQYKGKNLFKGANKKYKPVDWHKINSIRHSRQKTPEQLEKLRKRAIGKQKKLQNKLKDLEIDYELPVEN